MMAIYQERRPDREDLTAKEWPPILIHRIDRHRPDRKTWPLVAVVIALGLLAVAVAIDAGTAR